MIILSFLWVRVGFKADNLLLCRRWPSSDVAGDADVRRCELDRRW